MRIILICSFLLTSNIPLLGMGHPNWSSPAVRQQHNPINELQISLCQAIYNGNEKAVKSILDAGCNPNFACPIDAGNPKKPALLYYDLQYCISSPIVEATKKDSLKIVTLLFAAGANLNGRFPPLTEAASRGQLDIIKYLISQGANVNDLDSRGYRPLYAALMNDHIEVAQTLIERGASKNLCLINACDHYSKSNTVNADVIRWLMRNGASIKTRLKFGNSNEDDSLSIADLYCDENPFNKKNIPGLRAILMNEESWSGWSQARIRELYECCCNPKKNKRKIAQ